MNALAHFIQDYLLHWEDVLVPWGSMFGAVAVGLYVSLFGPSVRIWYEKKKRRSQQKARVIEELLRKAKEKEPSVERCRARMQIAKLAARNVGLTLLVLACVVGVFWSLNAWNAQQLRSSWTEIVEAHDEAKKGLFHKTIRRSDSTEEMAAIKRHELLCRTRASLAADQAVRGDIARIRIGQWTYFACMWEAGWETELCTEGEEGCVEIPFFESACLWAKRNWLKDERRTYVVEDCQSFPPNPFQASR